MNHHPRPDPPTSIRVALLPFMVIARLSVLALVVGIVLDALHVTALPRSFVLILACVIAIGYLVAPALIAIVWSAVLAASRAERPVHSAFKGVFGLFGGGTGCLDFLSLW